MRGTEFLFTGFIYYPVRELGSLFRHLFFKFFKIDDWIVCS